MAVFYPSCVCNLQVTFDDAFDVQEDEPESVDEATGQTARAEGPRTIRPLVLDKDRRTQADRLNTILNRVPLTCTVDLPSYRQAGTFNMTVAYRDLPIDPRVVFSAGVEIYMGAVDPGNFATGMVKVEPDGSRRSILNTVGPGGDRREDLLLMVGTVDEWDVLHSAGTSTVTLSGRDLRGLFLDRQIDPRVLTKLNLRRPIHDVVRQIVDHHPLGEKFLVEVYLDEWPEVGIEQTVTLRRGEESLVQLPSPADDKGVNKWRLTVANGSPTMTPIGGASQSYWDIITKYCYLVGAIPYFRADRIVIRPSRGLYQQLSDDKENARSRAFKDGQQRTVKDTGQKIGVRRIVFGRDVQEYRLARKYQGVTRPAVRVVSLNQSSKDRGVGKQIQAISPKQGAPIGTSNTAGQFGGDPAQRAPGNPNRAQTTTIAPSGTQAIQDFLTFSVPGYTDVDKLQEIADALREEIGRGEIGGSITTRNLASFGTDPSDPASGNQDPDLLRLRPGDALEILVDLRDLTSNAPLASSYVDSRGRRSFQAEVDDLAARIGQGAIGRDIARVIVAQSRGSILGLQNFYRVGTARFGWESRSGINISFDFQNFVEVRDDIIARVRTRQADQRQRLPTAPGRTGTSKTTRIS